MLGTPKGDLRVNEHTAAVDKSADSMRLTSMFVSETSPGARGKATYDMCRYFV